MEKKSFHRIYSLTWKSYPRSSQFTSSKNSCSSNIIDITSAFEMFTNVSLDTLSFHNVIAHIPILRALEFRHFLSAPFFGIVILISYIARLSSASAPVVKGPVAGYRNFLDPTFILRIRFIFSAVGIINDGYKKVNCSYV